MPIKSRRSTLAPTVADHVFPGPDRTAQRSQLMEPGRTVCKSASGTLNKTLTGGTMIFPGTGNLPLGPPSLFFPCRHDSARRARHGSALRRGRPRPLPLPLPLPLRKILSVAHGEARPYMSGRFQLIDHGQRKVLGGNATLAAGINNQRIVGLPERAGALARFNDCRRTQHGPVQIAFIT